MKKTIPFAIIILVCYPTIWLYGQVEEPGFSDLVPYVTTPMEVVDVMMELAQITDGDVLYDLGSGDGRIPIEASRRFGIRSIGVEIDADLVTKAKEHARDKGVEELTEFRQGDLFQMDFSDATILVMYLFPDVNLKLRPKIQALPKGTRVISHRFDMGDWEPDKVRSVELENGKEHVLYFWKVP